MSSSPPFAPLSAKRYLWGLAILAIIAACALRWGRLLFIVGFDLLLVGLYALVFPKILPMADDDASPHGSDSAARKIAATCAAVGFLLLLVTVAVFVSSPGPRRLPPETGAFMPAASQRQAILLGKKYTLLDETIAFDSVDSYNKAAKASVKLDQAGFSQLVDGGHIVNLPAGTVVLSLNSKGARGHIIEVRVLSGRQLGERWWVWHKTMARPVDN
jgi:hypothetical protein